ncbi:unnamed protein product [Pipistrellus nathusii]|uniref:Uncharacterized protein n=1 Tax=Pipistrellus nathusii TaxID=59473 RepID=A0ABN9Z5H2_PIPNA
MESSSLSVTRGLQPTPLPRTAQLGAGGWGTCVPPPSEGAAEAQQLSQTARSQRRASLLQKSSLGRREASWEDSLRVVARRGDRRKVRSGSESTGWAPERLRVTLH